MIAEDLRITDQDGAVLRPAALEEAMLFEAEPNVEVFVIANPAGGIAGVIGLTRAEEGVLLHKCTAHKGTETVAHLVAMLCDELLTRGETVFLAIESSPVTTAVEAMARFLAKDRVVVHVGARSILAYQCAPEQDDPRYIEKKVAETRRQYEALLAAPETTAQDRVRMERKIQRLSDDIDLLGNSLFQT